MNINSLNLLSAISAVALCVLLSGGCATNDADKINARKTLTEASVPFNSTAFLKAVAEGNKERVDLFLRAEMSVNINDSGTPLSTAVRNGRKEMASYLISKGADVNTSTYLGSPLSFACQKGDVEIVRILLENDAEVECESPEGTPLFIAAKNGFPKIVKLLLEYDADADYVSFPAKKTPLMAAAEKGDTESARILLENDADIDMLDANGDDALIYAVVDSHSELVNLLIENGARVSGETAVRALTEAAGRTQSEILTQLIEMGMNANTKIKKNGMPLLVWAVKNNYSDAAKILLKNGADASVGDQDGETALDYANTTGNKELAELIRQSLKKMEAKPEPVAKPTE